MKLRHRPISQVPSIEQIKDAAVKQFGQEIASIILETFRNIYDDLNKLQPQIVDSLPTAQQEIRGTLYIKRGIDTGADTLFICVNTGSAGYGFKQISFV